MKNFWKKIMVFLGVSTAMILLLSVDEIENNNAYSTANRINVNEICSGFLNGNYSSEKDWFTFSINNEGKINITFFSKMMENNNSYYDFYVYSSTNLDKALNRYIIRGYSTETHMNSLGLPAGRYYIRIESADNWSNVGYSFIINYTQGNNWEKEFNESWPTATNIDLNVGYYGSLRDSYSNEKDWYTFTLNNAGKINIRFFSKMMENNNNYYDFYVYNANDPDKALNRYIIRGYSTETYMNSLGLPAGKYYIRIESADNWSNADYSFVINYTQGNNWEKEFNESWPTATNINLNIEYYGSLRDTYSNEKDWYTFTLNNSRNINITFFSRMMENNNNYYDLYIYSSSDPDKPIIRKVIRGYETETIIDSLRLSTGKYYIRIESSDNWSNADYSFIVN